MTFEPPKGIRNLMLNSYNSINWASIEESPKS